MQKTTIALLAAVSSLFLALGMTATQAQAGHPKHHKGGVAVADPTPLVCTGGVPSTGDDDDDAGFTNGSFSGTYAYSFNGPATGTPLNALTGTGILTAGGDGNLTAGTEIVSDGTNTCQGMLTAGPSIYAIHADGTGAMCLSFTNFTQVAGTTCPIPPTSVFALVIQSPRSISTSEADSPGLGSVISGHLRLQHGGGEGDDGD